MAAHGLSKFSVIRLRVLGWLDFVKTLSLTTSNTSEFLIRVTTQHAQRPYCWQIWNWKKKDVTIIDWWCRVSDVFNLAGVNVYKKRKLLSLLPSLLQLSIVMEFVFIFLLSQTQGQLMARECLRSAFNHQGFDGRTKLRGHKRSAFSALPYTVLCAGQQPLHLWRVWNGPRPIASPVASPSHLEHSFHA